MLVLSRKTGERIMIGDTIVVEVVSIDLGRVRLGIIAPREVQILREELLPVAPALLPPGARIVTDDDGTP